MKPLRFITGLICLLVWATLALPLAAQGGVETEAPPAGAEDDGSMPLLDGIDEIIEGDDEVMGGGGSSYDPGSRRDPFKSLLVVQDKVKFKGKRPEGIPGLLIDEITLSGIFRTKNGYIAQVQVSDRQKSFLLKVGDQLYDGDVVSISAKEAVFKQNVQDPTALKPFREVVKSLNP